VFVNPALQEPFGLTVIEAAAHGVPTVATKNGGPVDIMATLHHGVVVDPTDSDAIAAALLRILANPQTWDDMSSSGVKNIMVRGWVTQSARGGFGGQVGAWGGVGQGRAGVELAARGLWVCLSNEIWCVVLRLAAFPSCISWLLAPSGPQPLYAMQAYSWPSHCKKYLESIEAEKHTLKSVRVSSRRHSLWRFVGCTVGRSLPLLQT
jgi:glycosyltransferase involved in cell wall biosynthesis